MTSDLKASMRREALDRRARLAAETPDAGALLAAMAQSPGVDGSGFERLGVRRGTKVAGYWPIRAEIDPRPLLSAVGDAGGVVLLPVILAASSVQGLEFRAWSPAAPLKRGPLGVMQPDAQAGLAEPDVVFAPLLAFDRRGGRLGYGGGYYDRTLRSLRARRRVFVVGLAFSGQEVAATPTGPHDEPVDAVLTERAFIRMGGAAR